MSTNGAIGFKLNNEIKAVYNHWDSYPDYLGMDVIRFLLSIQSMSLFKEKIEKIHWVDEDSTPTPEQIKKYGKFSNLKVGTRKLEDWDCLLMETQGIAGIKLIASGELDALIDRTNFLYDSLFCEWAYIINFDEMCLDIYEGFQHKPDPTNILGTKGHHVSYSADIEKFAEITISFVDPDGDRVFKDAYYPVKKVLSVPFENLTVDSLKVLEEEEE